MGAQGTVLDVSPRPSEDRTELILRATAALGEARAPKDVAHVIVSHAMAVMGAPSGVVTLLEADGGQLEVVAAQGFRDEAIRPYERMPLHLALPLCETARSGESFWLESRQAGFARFPDLEAASRVNGSHAWATVALRVGGRILGVLGLAFVEPRSFSPQDRAFIENLTHACAQALERARLLQGERALAAVVNNAPVMLWAIDEAGTILLSRGRALKSIGLQPDQDVGKNLFELWADHADTVHLHRRALAGESAHAVSEWMGRRLDVVIEPSKDAQGRITGAIGVAVDVTDRLTAEQTVVVQVGKLEALNRLTQTVGRADRIEEIYEAALAALCSALRADRASIVLFDPDGVMRFKAWTRLSDEYRAAVEGHSPWSRTTKDPPPVLVSDVFESADWAAYRPVFEREGIRALGFLPLLHQGTLLGKCMVYYDAPHVFTDEEVRLALAVASHVGFAIDRRQGRAALRDSDANLRIVMDTSPVSLTYIDADRRFRYVNRRFADLQGRSRDEILGRKVDEVLSPEAHAIVQPYLESAFEGESSDVDLTVQATSGHRHLSVQYVPNLGPDGDVRGVLGVVADITDRKEQEEELRVANERLKELDRLKTQFLNAVSHEMRTPLTPIQLQLDVLGAATSTPDSRKKAVAILDRNVRRLSRLVQEMVDVSRLQAGRFMVERAPMDLRQVVLEAVESYQEPARQAGIELVAQCEGALPIDADAQRLAQVLSNLLSNALKFTPSQRRIRVEAAGSDEYVTVRVRDEGVGLSEDQMGRLFEPFTQVHGPGEATRSGSGLGLYLCRGMVEAHGGRIWVESPGPGLGSTFAFALPRRPA